MGKYDYCHVVMQSDTGCVRSANEDYCGTQETINGLVAVVCDGMGGHVGGAVASQTAVSSILKYLTTQYFEDPKEAIVEALNTANKAVLYQAQLQSLTGMGSTCVILIVRNGKVYIGSVGDSRVYLVRNHVITQLTKDQSFVQMLVDMGQITTEEAEKHPRKNEITNAIGLANMKPATVLEEPITPVAGDCFVLCSDGLSGMISNKEIEKVVSSQTEYSSQDRANILVEKAKEAGGFDNVTVELVEFSVTPKIGKSKKMTGIVAATVTALLLLGAGIYHPTEMPTSDIPNKVEEIADTEATKHLEKTTETFYFNDITAKDNQKLLTITFLQDITKVTDFRGNDICNLPILSPDSVKVTNGLRKEGTSIATISFNGKASVNQTVTIVSETVIYCIIINQDQTMPFEEPEKIGSDLINRLTRAGESPKLQEITAPQNNTQDKALNTDSVQKSTAVTSDTAQIIPIEKDTTTAAPMHAPVPATTEEDTTQAEKVKVEQENK